MTDLVNLPKQKTRSIIDPLKLIYFFYGDPGVGKTTLVSKFPNVLVFFTESGASFINAFKHVINDWRHFLLILKYLDHHRPKLYQLLAIDTIDHLFRMCKQYVCRKRGIEHQSDEQWGKGYELVNDTFILAMLRFTSLGYGTIFTSHAADKEIKGRLIKTNKVVPSLAKQAQQVILPMADVIGRLGFEDDDSDNENRILFMSASETFDAKDRTGAFPKKCIITKDGTVEKELFSLVVNRKSKPAPTTLLKKKRKA